MDFTNDPAVDELRQRLIAFMDERVYPAEATYSAQMAAAGDPHFHPPVVEELKAEARRRGLWNLFMSDPSIGAGLTVSHYAPLAEITGRSPDLAPEALNCSAPDTGNMEILQRFGTDAQKAEWLTPLLEGEIRSCISMTEPDVASSDPTNLRTTIERDGDEYVVTGRKWFSSGAASPRCRFAIVMGVSSPEADPHHRHALVVVPLATAGVQVGATPTLFGWQDRGGHPEITFDGARVPAANLLGEEGQGFAIAQARLGPGRIHHCMRAIGAAERAHELMCLRAQSRVAFGRALAEQGVIQEWIAESRIRIEQARLLVLKAAWMIDHGGVDSARTEISAIKVAAPAALVYTADRAMQVFGAAGFTDLEPLARFYSMGRWLQVADGPDEVHRRSVARSELRRFSAPA
ncbi:MAG TPA: acyl-CoA dehydrogenase family protein [Acidimicrobiia bacterium]|jgi:acyl-CoA dehydrogenase